MNVNCIKIPDSTINQLRDITLIYLKNQDFNLTPHKGKIFIYKPLEYDLSRDKSVVDDIQSKLNIVCDLLVSGDKKIFPNTLDQYVKYLKDQYDITIRADNNKHLKGNNNYILSVYSIQNIEHSNLDQYVNTYLEDMNAEDLTNFIFNEDNYLYIASTIDN